MSIIAIVAAFAVLLPFVLSAGMEEIKPFTKKAFAASANYDTELQGRAIKSIGLRWAASVSGSAVTFRDDASFRMLKTPEVAQAEQPLIRMRGASWRHLSAILNGRFDEHTASATLSVAHTMIHLEKLLPGALINAVSAKVQVRGDFGALADYSGTAPTGFTGDLKPYCVTSQRDPTAGFFRPRIVEKFIPVTASSDDQQDVIRFEQDMVVAGLMLTCDNSTSGNPRTDGLVKNFRADHVGREGGSTEIARGSWGQFRALTQSIAGFNPEDYARSAGVVIVPFKNRANPQYGGAELFRTGSALTLHFDSASTVEADYTAATIAAGAQVVVTILAFTPVKGSGDVAAQVVDVGSVRQLSPALPLNARQRRVQKRMA